ncbi:MAG: ABC transporter substrate-binding protein [Candidatus Limnocylindria bacterium]
MRRHYPVLSVLATAAIVLSACGAAQGTPAASDGGDGTATGGVVRIGHGGYPDSLNPGNGVLAEAYTLYELVYDTPIAVTSSGEYVPELATEWSASEDGLVWTMTIVEGATFHDGEPLTAQDVAFSIQLYRDTEAFPFLPSYAAPFSTIEAPDDTTVRLTTEEPLNTFEAYMAFIYVLPQHIWEGEADPVEFQNAAMIGSGAFRLVEATQGEFIELAANTDYWSTPPNVAGVILRTIDNADARITALTTGEVDAIAEFPATAVSTLQNAEDVTVHVAAVAAGGDLRDVFFNVTTEENCPPDGGVCSGHPALKDIAVRRALATAIDKQQIIDVATLGTAAPGLSLVPPGLGAYYGADVEDYAFDVEAANALLDEAGYEDADGDGVRECLPDQGCDDLTFRFHYADDIDTGPREAELLQGMWAEIGVAIEIQGLDPDTLTSICCPSFDYDIMMWGWGSDPDPAFLLGVALCGEIETGFSETGYCNAEYDAMYDAQAVEQDHDGRVAIIHDMQRLLIEEVPYVIPYYQQVIEAWRTDTFTGWTEGDPTLGLTDPSSLTKLRPAE